MQTTELITKSLDKRGRKYRQALNRARSDFSEDAVHDLRVATRRLLALLDLVRTIGADSPVRGLRRDLKAQLDSLDPLRDTQVMLKEVGEQIDALPSLVRFRADLAAREQKLLNRARKSIGEISFTEFSRLVGGLSSLRAHLSGAVHGGDPLAAIDGAYRKVVRRAGAVDQADPTSFHRLRVAFKKFRYGVEILYPLLPGYPRENLTAMDGYQTALGQIQDLVVLLAATEEFSAEDGAFEVMPVRSHYEQRRDQAIEAFLGEKEEMARFWRAEEPQPFPWEKKS
jgi:CHAD domain-containing protein